MAYRDIIENLRRLGATWRERLDLTEVKVADLDDGVAALEAAQYLGTARSAVYTPVGPLTIAPAGQPIVIAGPASGFIRIVERLFLSTADSNAATAEITLNPLGYFLRRATSLAGTSFVNPELLPLALAFGDSVSIAHTAGTGSLIVYYQYADYPSAGLTVAAVQSNGVTPVTLVPAAAAGYFSRVASFGNLMPNGAVAPRPALVVRNDDTASNTVNVCRGGALLFRASPVASLAEATAGVVGTIAEIPVREGAGQALGVSLLAGHATRPWFAVLCYETLPLP